MQAQTSVPMIDAQLKQLSAKATEASLELSTSTSAQMDEPEIRPRLDRADGRKLSEKDIEAIRRLRITVNVTSVHYQPGRAGSLMCAVLLRTTFRIQTGHKLKFAMLPMSAQDTKSAKDTQGRTQAPQVDIVEHYPSRDQQEPVRRIQRTENISRQPQIAVNAVGNGGSLGGIGTTIQDIYQDFWTISLTPNLQTLENWPTRIEWHYEDEHGIFYPKEIDLLVIVQTKKFTAGNSFPFQLRLENNITVDVHASPFGFAEIKRLVAGRRSGHKGWVFNIQGKFEPSLAKDALRKAREDPNTIGLPPPMREWWQRQKA